MRSIIWVLLLTLFHATTVLGVSAVVDSALVKGVGSADLPVKVALDAGEQSGRASATIRIHAGREIIWGLITQCSEALRLVPGLVGCIVLETAADHSWQRIRHVLDYSWYVPRLTYEIRATYAEPERVDVERVAGDLTRMQGSWILKGEGQYTIAQYRMELVPGFWVPDWIVRAALKRDLPKMLRALQARAELLQNELIGK